MKTLFTFLICLSIGLLTSCSDDTTSDIDKMQSTGTIMGFDRSMCICCGGWILKIDEDETSYRFDELPEDSDIVLSEVHIPVKLNWSISSECLFNTFVEIETIELN